MLLEFSKLRLKSCYRVACIFQSLRLKPWKNKLPIKKKCVTIHPSPLWAKHAAPTRTRLSEKIEKRLRLIIKMVSTGRGINTTLGHGLAVLAFQKD